MREPDGAGGVTWLLIALGSIVVLLVISRLKRKTQSQWNLSPQIPQVSEEEAESLSADIRELASTGYERASKKALDDGKSARFAHECGILDAGFCVLANKNELRANDTVRQNLQMELVPFNILTSDFGKQAVREFLVWKFFPNQAAMDILDQAFDEFVEQFLVGGDTDPPTDQEVRQFIFSGLYGWQSLAQQAMARRD